MSDPMFFINTFKNLRSQTDNRGLKERLIFQNPVSPEQTRDSPKRQAHVEDR